MANGNFTKNGISYTSSSGLSFGDKAGLRIVADHTEKILEDMNKAKARAFEKIGLIAEGYAKRLCPVDTGRLRNSITHTTDGNDVYIGTNVEYAKYVELGSSRRAAKPYLRPAANDHLAEYNAIIKEEFEKG